MGRSAGLIVTGAAAVVLLWGLWVFNRLVALRVRARGAWSDIDVQLKRRWDLIPRLVEVVRGYAGHESATLQRVVESRAVAQRAVSPGERGRAESALRGDATRLVALAERYPDLRADELFRSLHDDLVEVEGALQSARRYYNAVVRDLNTAIAVFPAGLVARAFGFRRLEFFQLEDVEETTAPAVSLEQPP